jgi:hypothetical protein
MKGIYRLEIENNDLDASNQIVEILENHMTNHQSKVEATFIEVEGEEQ